MRTQFDCPARKRIVKKVKPTPQSAAGDNPHTSTIFAQAGAKITSVASGGGVTWG
jgi:hypothetical protein